MHKIKEDGKNGTVDVQGDRIVRTIKKTLGRDDTQTIPVRSIHEVKVDRKLMGSDVVVVSTSAKSYTWKSPTAEALSDEILNAMA
jgi:hypothetical protein